MLWNHVTVDTDREHLAAVMTCLLHTVWMHRLLGPMSLNARKVAVLSLGSLESLDYVQIMPTNDTLQQAVRETVALIEEADKKALNQESIVVQMHFGATNETNANNTVSWLSRLTQSMKISDASSISTAPATFEQWRLTFHLRSSLHAQDSALFYASMRQQIVDALLHISVCASEYAQLPSLQTHDKHPFQWQLQICS